MTRNEAVRVLKLIARAHNTAVDSDLTDAWFQAALERCDYETGLAIARSLTETSRYMPKPAEFNEAMRLHHNPARRALTPSTDTWPPSPETKERIKAEMRATRDALANGTPVPSWQ